MVIGKGLPKVLVIGGDKGFGCPFSILDKEDSLDRVREKDEAVTHSSTDSSSPCLTAVIRREPMH